MTMLLLHGWMLKYLYYSSSQWIRFPFVLLSYRSLLPITRVLINSILGILFVAKINKRSDGFASSAYCDPSIVAKLHANISSTQRDAFLISSKLSCFTTTAGISIPVTSRIVMGCV